jgi:hypothetical protein
VLATIINDDAIACNTGSDSCAEGTAYAMMLVEVTSEDRSAVGEAALSVVLPDWVARCEATYEGCAAVWNDTVGAARSMTATASN